MRHILLTFGMSLLLGVMTLPTQAQVVNDDNEDGVVKLDANRSRYEYVEGQVLLKFKDEHRVQVNAARGRFRSTSADRVTQVLQKFGAEEMEQLLPQEKPGRKLRRAKAYNGDIIQERDLSQLYLIKVSAEHALETMQLVDELKTLDEVEFAEPNYILHTLADNHIADSYNTNPMASQQWYLDAYGVKELWNKPIINPTRPVIAIIDTGVDLTHPDLKDNLWTNQAEAEGEAGYDNDGNGFKNDVHGWDFINNTGNIRDNNMHGTHVAGIAAASNNGTGIVGANPRALIMSVTAMQSDGTGDVATIIKGINYAVANGATVLNLSLGTYANSSALRQALEKAYQSAVLVAAAGNDGLEIYMRQMFPAAYSFVLGVMASDPSGSKASFSNSDPDGPNYSSMSTLQDPDGFNYEIKAPGTNMLSTIPGGKYKALQGTSMAAPLVAGSISALTMVKDYLRNDQSVHQEILWGDLTHTDNIAQAYALENRPAELDLVNMQFQNRKDMADETEDDYSNDHEIDAGEIVSIYPVIRTTFGSASSIKMHLEMGDEFEDPNTVEIYSDAEHKVDFGWNLDAYGRNVSLNPLEFKVANNVADNRHIKMKLVATCDEATESVERPFTIVVTNMVKIGGLLTENRTLTADHVYYVNESLGIQEGDTLTIEPGTRLEFGANRKIQSWGKLVAKGTPENPITFINHAGENPWNGVVTHESSGEHKYEAAVYSNADSTLFTFLPTEQTFKKLTSFSKRIYYNSSTESATDKRFWLSDYIEDWSEDMTDKQNKLADPNYLTPFMLQAMSEWKAYWSQYSTQETDDRTTLTDIRLIFSSWKTYDNPRDTISYCRIEGVHGEGGGPVFPYMKDCSLKSLQNYFTNGERNIIQDSNGTGHSKHSNIVNNYNLALAPTYSGLFYLNYFNNASRKGSYQYWLADDSKIPHEDISTTPSYLGTSREDIVRPHIYEAGNASYTTWGTINLSNMPDRPFAEAHGIVWKVCVNGKDAQDEYEDLAPLGIGKHKFEVYFNRPMNKAVAPNITFGVRDPWTQNAVNEDGSWNEDGTIYTAYKTITGKTKSDGINRIYVYGAEDNEFFEIPYEKSRFNIQIQAAGSMATGFMAEAGLGKVSLTWDNSHNDFEDAMGFNVYRYQLDADGNEVNSKRLNTEIVDIEATSYTDYDVTPGETYHYYYKVLSTDLQEYDVSNVVAATPLTSELGDANGSGIVDVADVITTVNYAAGMEPKPFIFEAADMNTDQLIDILDVIGIIQKILHPEATARFMTENTATYTVENGVLYVESPVALAGVQAQLSLDGRGKMEDVRVASDLDGFEHTSAWLTDNVYLFLAYNLNGKVLTPGKHALLYIGDADLSSLRLSDAQGSNVTAVAGEGTVIKDAMGSKVMNAKGIWNLNGQKIGSDKLRKGVYIIDGNKVVK